MKSKTDDLRIINIQELVSPQEIINSVSPSEKGFATIINARNQIKNILNKIESELNYQMLVLATGGLSDLFINEVSEDIIVNKDLTITGLYIAYEEGKY